MRIGPAGIPIGCADENAGKCSTAMGIEYCRKIGLDAMEVEFVHGVFMGEPAAKDAGKTAKANNIKLSCHAPYYINCCAKEKHKIKASILHIVSTAQAAHWLSASPIVIHPGYYMGRDQNTCKKLVYSAFLECLEEMETRGICNVVLGAELTGKKTAYGSLDEIIDLSMHFGIDKVAPVIDFAHYHAREKKIEKKEDYLEIFSLVQDRLGKSALKTIHCHFSGINFTDAGESHHLPISSNSPPYMAFAQACINAGIEGTIICESPMLEKDALILKKEFDQVGKRD